MTLSAQERGDLLPTGVLGEIDLFCKDAKGRSSDTYILENESGETASSHESSPEVFDLGAGDQALKSLKEDDPLADTPDNPTCYIGTKDVEDGLFRPPSMSVTVRRCILTVGRYNIYSEAETDRTFSARATKVQRGLGTVDPEVAETGLVLSLERLKAATE